MARFEGARTGRGVRTRGREGMLVLLALAAAAPAAADDGAGRWHGSRQVAFARACDLGRWDEARAQLELAGAAAEAAIASAATAGARANARLEHAHVLIERAAVELDRSLYHVRDLATVESSLAAARERLHAVSAGASAGPGAVGAASAEARLRFTEARVLYTRGFEDAEVWGAAQRGFEAVLAAAARLGDEALAAEARFYLGLIAQQRGEARLARPLFAEVLRSAEARADDFLASFVERHLAWLDADAGEVALAEDRFRRSLALRERGGAAVYVPFARIALADHLERSGEVAEALRLRHTALDEAERVGSRRAAANAARALGRQMRIAGDLAGARPVLARGRVAAEAYRDPALVASLDAELAALGATGAP